MTNLRQIIAGGLIALITILAVAGGIALSLVEREEVARVEPTSTQTLETQTSIPASPSPSNTPSPDSTAAPFETEPITSTSSPSPTPSQTATLPPPPTSCLPSRWLAAIYHRRR